MIIMAIIDPAFGVNDFKTAKITSESETIVNNILTLLFMRPGSYPSIPHLGIHIQDYLYQFFDEINCDDITSLIAAQCQEFVPSVNSGSLVVKKTVTESGKPVLLINTFLHSYFHNEIESSSFLVIIATTSTN